MKFKELKQHIKNLAKEIKVAKTLRKESEYGYVYGLLRLQYEARHHHISYCLLRGRTIEEIEPTVREGNGANPSFINTIMESIEPKEEVNEEAVCCGA